jgi:acetyl esterase/lipase
MKAGAALMLSALLAACSPLRAFNAIVPQDRGAVAAERGSAYGAHPRQRVDLYRPRGWRSGQPALPIILFLYGGSWQQGEREGYSFAARALADAGFLVAVPDYRLVPEVRFRPSLRIPPRPCAGFAPMPQGSGAMATGSC